MNMTRESKLLISLLRLCSSEMFGATTSFHKFEAQVTLVEVVCTPITLQLNGVIFIVLQFFTLLMVLLCIINAQVTSTIK
jgi:hypothetical protein